MRFRYSILALILLSIFLNSKKTQAQTPNWLWAKPLGDSSYVTTSMVLDQADNIYITGAFQGTADFDPSANTYNLTSFDYATYVAKYTSSGSFIWAKKLGGAVGSTIGSNLCLDDFGDIYITGRFSVKSDFDPGPDSFFLSSIVSYSSDIFITKLDNSGNFKWAKSMGGTEIDEAYCISSDRFGNIFTTGTFYNTADFDPGAGVYNLTTFGLADAFISKLDSAGNFIWAKQIGGLDYDNIAAQYVDSSGNLYVVGAFKSTVDFDPGPATYNLTSIGALDIYILKLDSAGSFLWAKSIGGLQNQGASAITQDKHGNILITGYFYSTVDFDPGPAIFNVTSAGSSDIFILKLNSNGDFIWVKSMGSLSEEVVRAISLDSTGNIYTAGDFYGTADFDPGPNNFNLTSSGFSDVYVSKLDSLGNFKWAISANGTFLDYGMNVAVGLSSNAYVSGIFRSASLTFGSSTLINTDNTTDTYQIYLANVDIVTGISDLQINNRFLVFPNPSKNYLNIYLPDYNSHANISITDMAGNVIFKNTFYGTPKMQINTQKFKPGIYMIQIQTGNHTQIQKVIIIK